MQPIQSPRQETHPQFKNLAQTVSSEHSNDSPATRQRKKDWKAANFAELIWREHGFDKTIDETLINSWINPMQRLLDDEYKLWMTFVDPPSDGYWDIPISPNSKYFPIY